MELRNGKKMRTVLRGKKEYGEDLFPGIRDDITVDHITTKLTWRDIHVLASVSHGWRRAIQSRQVYEARLRHGATETFVLVHHNRKPFKEISLWSMKDKSCLMLPRIVSELSYRVTSQTKLVAMDGRVYLFGLDLRPYVLDLAGQRQWKRCSSRGAKRFYDSLECGVMNGKIYAFASGWATFEHPRSQVYDLKRNTCSLIKPMPSRRSDYQVAVVQDELVLYSGEFVTKNCRIKPAEFVDFYHPVKDEWRVVEKFKRPMEQLFVAEGRMHSMSSACIYVYDFHGNSWAELHSFSFAPIAQFDVIPLRVLAVGDELLATIYMEKHEVPYRNRFCLVRSKGFNSLKKELLWEPAELNAPFVDFTYGDYNLYSMYPIEL
ncbi:unnamed protein product [Calypogeia fissa]